MLISLMIDFDGKWEEHLPYMEISYHDNHHSSIDIPPCSQQEKSGTRLCSLELGESILVGPNI